jgi:hypothetical protein
MTAAELRNASNLPRRTIFSALQVLREGGLLNQRRSLQDTRQTYFWLADAPVASPAASLAPAGSLAALHAEATRGTAPASAAL